MPIRTQIARLPATLPTPGSGILTLRSDPLGARASRPPASPVRDRSPLVLTPLFTALRRFSARFAQGLALSAWSIGHADRLAAGPSRQRRHDRIGGVTQEPHGVVSEREVRAVACGDQNWNMSPSRSAKCRSAETLATASVA